jgi:hypothetical protein
MAFDLAGRGQFPLDAPDASAPARLPGDPIAGLQLFRHAVLRRKLRPQFCSPDWLALSAPRRPQGNRSILLKETEGFFILIDQNPLKNLDSKK